MCYKINIMNIALFDLDNTLINGDSDYEWGNFLVENNFVDPDYYQRKNDAFFEQYKKGTLCPREFAKFSYEPLAKYDFEFLLNIRERFFEERIKPIRFKINDTEDGYLSPDVLQIDGASYVEGMDDYEWIFQIASKDFESLLKLLKATEELSDDIPNELMNYLKDNGTKVSEIRELCQDNEIEHYFQNWF